MDLTQLSQEDEGLRQVTLADLVTTATCPTCHAPAGGRCVTRSGKPAADSHNGRYDAVEQAAGITQNRAALRRSAGGFSYGIDRQAETALLTAYAARLRPTAQQDDEPAAPAPAAEPRQNATPARRQLDHALTALARTDIPTSTLLDRLTLRLRAAHLVALDAVYLDDLTYVTARALTGPGVQAVTDQVQEQLLRALPEPRPGETCTAYASRITAHPDTLRERDAAIADRLATAARTTGAPAAVALLHLLGGTR
ncbi:hypothetical protein [Streptomyces subrutilus]|uniref:zinc finger domain-containing protein n=1 Tax=Streptomyces subrutilus TaxID=36818 RepID=UPI002E0DA1A8|nr:hypothetical protein OG479_32875 [Streptomyces subrutilus]